MGVVCGLRPQTTPISSFSTAIPEGESGQSNERFMPQIQNTSLIPFLSSYDTFPI
jgi:hypothetical protein